MHFIKPLILRSSALLSICLLTLIPLYTAQAQPVAYYNIYIDADRSNNKESGIAIEQGIRSAFAENKMHLNGIPVNIIIKDHHGSTPRSKKHLNTFLNDPNALLVFGGLHSPPLIANRNFINDQGILTLVPWAAATPITRPENLNNWIFRLSLDDSKAGEVLVNQAISKEGFKRPYLLLEDTGWGKANVKTMGKAFEHRNLKPIGIEYFKWNIGMNTARIAIKKIIQEKPDVLILVANTPEGVKLSKAMSELPAEQRIPIRSHWGITGGRFVELLGPNNLRKLDLQFLQTRFSFFTTPMSNAGIIALKDFTSTSKNDTKSPSDIKAPAGFIHAYDLTKILIAASKQADLSGDPENDRLKLKTALENLNTTVHGLIKTYKKPFSEYSLTQMDSHEALSFEDFIMAKFSATGDIYPFTKPSLGDVNVH